MLKRVVTKAATTSRAVTVMSSDRWAFGMMESKRQLSLQVAAPMLEKIRAEGPGVTVVASGTSCRHQISELSSYHPKHMAEILADALPNSNGSS